MIQDPGPLQLRPTAASGSRCRRTAAILAFVAVACARSPSRPPTSAVENVVGPCLSLCALEEAVRARMSGEPGTIAVAFIDLETGQRFGINDDVVMHAASTMKVPVLIEVFRQAEQGRFDLGDSIEVRNTFRSIADSSAYVLNVADDSEATLYNRIGGRASVRELARLMTVRSSNLATNLLIELTTPGAVRAMLERANVTGMNVQRGVEDTPAFRRGLNNTTTAAGLAGSLELIARCSVTSQAACDELADILAAQEFNEMIPAGLPAGTRVAHKTGWITGIQHDGAIVYPSGRAPYVLVILTRDFEKPEQANRAGADISKIIWERMVINGP